MPAKNFVVAIELGSTRIKGIAGQKKPDGSIAVLAMVSEDAKQCIRNGVVYNIDKTVQCITSIVQRLKGQLKSGIKHVYVGVGGQSIHSERNVIVREIHSSIPVTQQLIVEMMDQNRSMEYPDMEILDVEVQEYRADALMQTEPVGIQCSRLDGNFLNILQSKRHYQKLNTCFDIAGVKLAEIYLAPFALADAVLTPVEKRSGCVLVDLGADTTTVMVYYKNIVRHIAVIPLGGNNITKDICTLQVEECEAEKLKLRYASAYTAPEDIDTTLKYDIDRDRKVESSRFIDIIEGRVQEIIANVWNQIPADFSEKILGGIVLTGGAANMKNMDVAFRKHTSIDKVRLAKFVTYTINTTNAEINAHDGTMNTLLGLLAKGDQNCYVPSEEMKPQDIFGMNDASKPTDGIDTKPQLRDPHSLPSGVVQSAAEKAAAEKAAADALRKVDEEPKPHAGEEEPHHLEGEDKNKKPSLGTRFAKWLTSIATPDE